MDGVVGDAGEDAVGGDDEEVDEEGGGDGGEGEGEAREGVAPDADEGGAGQRDEDEVAGVGGDAGDDADEDEDVGERLGVRDEDELADQGFDEARLLRHADADHGDDGNADGVEVHEVLDDAGVHEADAVDGQQAAGRGRDVFGLVGLGVDDLVGDGRAEHIEDVRQDDHDADQQHEDDDGMRDPVADAFDDVEDALH